MTKDMFISNILTVEAIVIYEMLQDKLSYRQVTRNMYLGILPTKYNRQLMAKVIFSVSLSNLFIMNLFLHSSAEQKN